MSAFSRVSFRPPNSLRAFNAPGNNSKPSGGGQASQLGGDFKAWSDGQAAGLGIQPNSHRAAIFDRMAQEQWARWTPAQRGFASKQAEYAAPNASRANRSGLPFGSWTDPQTGERFVTDADGRATSEQAKINHMSSSDSAGAWTANMAAQYHAANQEVPGWIQSIAGAANTRNPWAWYNTRYVDRRAWDQAGDDIRQMLLNRRGVR